MGAVGSRVEPVVGPGIDEGLLRRLWEISWAATSRVTEHHCLDPWPAMRQRWTESDSAESVGLWAAYEADEPVGVLEMALPLRDNQHLAELAVYVHPGHEGHGHGSALVQTGLDAARAAGRRMAFAGFPATLEGPSRGQEMLERHGFALAQYDVSKSLDVAGQRQRWPDLLARIEGRSPAYRLVTWADRCPEEHVEHYCSLAGSFMGLIPLGDLDYEDELWDEDRLREREQRNAMIGRHDLTTLVLAADGSPAGYTCLVWDDARRDVVEQDATLVVPGHRGHGLGLRLKLANQLALVDRNPDAVSIETGNAAENLHMNAINEHLGFRPVGRGLEMQRDLG